MLEPTSQRLTNTRPLSDIDPQVGHGGPASLGHGVSSPLSRPEPAEATPTLPGRGPSRARHISISRFPRALPPRWQHPPGPLRGRGRRPSGAVGRRPSVRPNRNTLKVKEPPLRTAQTVMGSFRIRPGHQRFIELGTATATRLASLGKLVVGALTHCRLAPFLPCPHSSRG